MAVFIWRGNLHLSGRGKKVLSRSSTPTLSVEEEKKKISLRYKSCFCSRKKKNSYYKESFFLEKEEKQISQQEKKTNIFSHMKEVI